MKAAVRLVDLLCLSLGDFSYISHTKVWFAREKKEEKKEEKND